MPSVLVDLEADATCTERSPVLSSDHTKSTSNGLNVDEFDSPGFYSILTAPYEPSTTSHDLEASLDLAWDFDLVETGSLRHSCDAFGEDVGGSSSEDIQGSDIVMPVVGDISPSDQPRPLYTPHGKWVVAGLNPIAGWKELAFLRGSTCLTSVKKGYLAGKSITYINKMWSMSQASERKWFTSELALYKSWKHLRPLQGLVVPHIINVYATPDRIDTAVELPHDCFWIEASADMPPVLKKRCVEAFQKLHQQGIFHGDVELRHMLIGADCKVTIIDFRRSRSSHPILDVGLQAASSDDFDMEMRRVKFKLDYEGARDKEHAKIRRAADLMKKNKKIIQEQGRCAKPEDIRHLSEDDLTSPAISEDLWSKEWIVACDSSPRRFVVPGQTSQDVKVAVEGFLSSILKLEKESCYASSPIVTSVTDPTADFLGEDIFDLIDSPSTFEYRLRKRKRDIERLCSGCVSNADGVCHGPKRRRMSDSNQPSQSLVLAPLPFARILSPLNASSSPRKPDSPHMFVESGRPRKRKRKSMDCAVGTESQVEPMTFSDFMLLAEIEKDWEREQARKKRRSLTSITADYGSDCDRSLSPPPNVSSPEFNPSDLVPRRASPCLSADEAARRITIAPLSAESAIPSVKSPPPIIVRDFVNKQFDGPRGYYVPHPPTENRIGLERAKHIRQQNAIRCVDLGLRYPITESRSGEIVPHIHPLPYTFQFEQERDKSTRKKRRERGLGGLIRKRNAEQFNDQERRDIELMRCWKEAQDMGTMSKVRFPPLDSTASGGLGSDGRESNEPYKSSERSQPTRGILKTPKPIKTYNYQQPWEQPHDEGYSPKLGPLREDLDRSGGFGMLGVRFHHDITKSEESFRREVLRRVRASDTMKTSVEQVWKDEEEKMQERRRTDMTSSLEDLGQICGPSFEDLEEERLVEELLVQECS